MTLERLSAKKVYYYVICTFTLFILMWGTVDVASSIISFFVFRPPDISMDSPTASKGNVPSDAKGMTDPFVDDYYQSRMIFDRMGDSLARMIVAGSLFAFFSLKIKEMERAEKL